MNHKTWRDRFRPQIVRVLRETAGEGQGAINRALRALWDELRMGERRMHPYKIFRDEARRQQGHWRRVISPETEGDQSALALPFEEEPAPLPRTE